MVLFNFVLHEVIISLKTFGDGLYDYGTDVVRNAEQNKQVKCLLFLSELYHMYLCVFIVFAFTFSVSLYRSSCTLSFHVRGRAWIAGHIV